MTIPPIAKEAEDLIIAEEVSSQALYTKLYRHTSWPQGQSGVTIGIGYDCGYSTRDKLHRDWAGRIPVPMVTALERACGVKGDRAGALARDLRGSVDIPWDAAIAEFREVEVPQWIERVIKIIPAAEKLPPECLGALVSLGYNRGTSFDQQGDRYLEMRNIKALIHRGELAKVAHEFRAMKRLWPMRSMRGLVARREHEAILWEHGLKALPAPATA